MKHKNKKKENKSWIIGLVLIIIILCVFFAKNYISNEINQYKLYNDYTRANQIMTLSFNKNFDIQFSNIRLIQSSNYDKKISKGDLIYDFANYNMIPILDYMKEPSENESLIKSFSLFTDFLANYNMATIGNREDIFKKNDNGFYYTYKNNKYVYCIEKQVISKGAFNKLYDQYLHTINQSTVSNNFISKLYNTAEINSKYSYKSLSNKIKNDYSNFYKENKDIILRIISGYLNDFVDYLNTFLEIDKEGNVPPTLKSKIDTETLKLEFSFTKLDRIYVPYSRYYLFSYQLDILSVWKQLKELGYPMIYS